MKWRSWSCEEADDNDDDDDDDEEEEEEKKKKFKMRRFDGNKMCNVYVDLRERG